MGDLLSKRDPKGYPFPHPYRSLISRLDVGRTEISQCAARGFCEGYRPLVHLEETALRHQTAGGLVGRSDLLEGGAGLFERVERGLQVSARREHAASREPGHRAPRAAPESRGDVLELRREGVGFADVVPSELDAHRFGQEERAARRAMSMTRGLRQTLA